MANEFQHGLCGCFDNCTICIVTYCIPCYTAGKIAEKVGESCLCCALVQFIPIVDIICVGNLRQKVREQKGIAGSFLGDICCGFFCYFCVLAQAAQEVHAFGDGMAQSIARE